MKVSILLSFFAGAAYVSAHGFITKITVGGTTFPGNNPSSGKKDNARIVWDYDNNGPVVASRLDNRDIACSLNSKSVGTFGKAKPGDELTFFWSQWSESHRGPTMTYMAAIPNGESMNNFDPTKLTWYKIHQIGLTSPDGPKGKWASDEMIKAGRTMKVKIPQGIPSGKYIIRHEFLALHNAPNPKKMAQFYPVCANFEITDGKAGAKLEGTGVKFPGAYKANDPGVLIDIHKGVKTYTIPGPPVIAGGTNENIGPGGGKKIRGMEWRENA
ncbi:glycoside hydrolase [Peziza echinospora]|nr:glycoside hydrolase [Peziza echinospora]